MWQKYHKIAERQLESGKLKSVEQHAQKALEFARKADDAKQMAQTLSVLSELYTKTKDPKLVETLKLSAEATEKAYGSDSAEFAVELFCLATELKRIGDRESYEKERDKAVQTLERRSDATVLLIKILGEVVQDKFEQKSYDEAEEQLLKAIKLIKEEYGTSSTHMEFAGLLYLEILKETGRSDDLLKSIIDGCAECEDGIPEDEHDRRHTDPEYLAIREQIEEAIEKKEFEQAIEVLRKGVKRFDELANEAAATIDRNDPFFEIKAGRYDMYKAMVDTNLATMLRMRGVQDKSFDDLQEAEEILLDLLGQIETTHLRSQYAQTLMDRLILGGVDTMSKRSEELNKIESELAKLPECTAKFYTSALLKYIRYGATVESRAAMMDAVRANPHVPLVMSSVDRKAPEADHYELLADAEEYCLDATNHWIEIPGATDFLADVIKRSLHNHTDKLPILGQI